MGEWHEGLASKGRLIGDILTAAKRQLELATQGGEEHLAELDRVLEHRAALMAQVDEIDASLPARESGPQDARIDGMLAAIKEDLLAIDRLDGQTRAAVEALMQDNGAQMRKAQQTRQGVGAYLNANAQVGSLYIDQKK